MEKACFFCVSDVEGLTYEVVRMRPEPQPSEQRALQRNDPAADYTDEEEPQADSRSSRGTPQFAWAQ